MLGFNALLFGTTSLSTVLVSSDPSFSNVSLLIQPTASDTAVLDYSGVGGTARSVTMTSGTLSSSWAAFGSQSILNPNLTVSTSPDIDLSGQDWMVRCKVKLTAATVVDEGEIAARWSNSGQKQFRCHLQNPTVGGTYANMSFSRTTDGSNNIIHTVSYAFAVGGVYELAWSWKAGTLRMFVNGTRVFEQSGLSSLYASSSDLNIGKLQSWTGGAFSQFQGYMDAFELVRGTAVVTSDYTPGSAAPVNRPGTILLLNFEGAVADDAAGRGKTASVTGTVSVSSTGNFSGMGSVSLGGGRASLGSSSYNALGTGAWTVEALYSPSSSAGYHTLWATRNAASNYSDAISFGYNGADTYAYTSAFYASGSGVLTYSGYQYLAWTFDGTTLRSYRNGTLTGSSAFSINLSYTTATLGALNNGDEAGIGSLAALRMTRGVVRPIMVPTAPWPTSGT